MTTADILGKIRDFQRPVRMCIWVICIAISYMYAVLNKTKVNPIDEVLTQTILYGMFADLGIYGMARTYEKTTQAKIDGGNPTTITTNKTITTISDDKPTDN